VTWVKLNFIESMRRVAWLSRGNYTVAVSNSSRQWGWFANASVRQGETTSLQSRPLIRPEEVLRDMRADEQIVLVKNRAPIRCGRAIYFRRKDMRSSLFAIAHIRFVTISANA
jgi:type IV secretion system protein VirD4